MKPRTRYLIGITAVMIVMGEVIILLSTWMSWKYALISLDSVLTPIVFSVWLSVIHGAMLLRVIYGQKNPFKDVFVFVWFFVLIGNALLLSLGMSRAVLDEALPKEVSPEVSSAMMLLFRVASYFAALFIREIRTKQPTITI